MPLGWGSVAGQKNLAPPYYGKRAVFASVRALFSLELLMALPVLLCLQYCHYSWQYFANAVK